MAALITALELAKSAWNCENVNCSASPDTTRALCVGCHRVLCRLCGGPFSKTAPLEVFSCQFCLANQYNDIRGLAAAPMTTLERERVRALVRGRMYLLGASKRSSTGAAYASGRAKLSEFLTTLALPLLPASPAALMDYTVYGLSTLGLDSSTLKNRLLAVGDVYDYLRINLNMGHIKNPLRDAQLTSLLKTMGINFKKAGGGSLALTAAELHGLYHFGFTNPNRRGRWARLFFIFLNLGMLRHTAVQALVVVYTVEADGVHFHAGSSVSVYVHPQTGRSCIDVLIDSDKNMNALKAAQDGGRHAYIPGVLDHMNVAAADDLIEYLIRERPPSGGPLFAYPAKKGAGFSAKPCSTFNTYLRDAFKRAFPDASPSRVTNIGSHSGRKTLAQLLWDAGFARRLIADAGGWFLKKEAMDLYFKTAPYVILNAIASLRPDGAATSAGVTSVATRHD